jgi:formate dehydrogenase beta subunit
MSKLLFSTWQGELIDNRDKSPDEWSKSEFRLPETYHAEQDSKAFIGWDGVAIFDEDIDAVELANQYAAQYQKYSQACGRCAPGKWGGKILYDLLDKIARGEGSHDDITHLKEIAQTMMSTSKCEIGKTVPKPILDLMEHYKEQFDLCIDAKTPSKHYNDDTSYIAKITAPCTDLCPAHVDIPAYIEGVRDMTFSESLVATRQTMPLAHTCGRVCPHPCEDACRRANLDEPISIMELKRIGADYETDHELEWFHPTTPKPLRNDGKKVAVIGAGPAGLTVAYYLALEGIKVDIFEELPVNGGEVAVGVPEYRMPVDKYNRDIDLVLDMEAVSITNNHRVTADRLKEIEAEYDATFLGFGARLSKKIRAKNEDPSKDGYWGAIDMLDKVNLWHKYGIGSPASNELKDKVVVCVGGGFTSMDVVRCSIREGAKKVIMLYRRDEKTIIRNTTYEEYHEAVEEGVEFIFHSAIEEIYDDGEKITKIKVNKFDLVPDPNGGRAQLIKQEDGDFYLDVDYLIPAVSQSLDLQILPEEWNIKMTSWSSIMTNGKDFMTSKEGVFAAGDCEYGPMTIVNAVGQAKRAASVISRYLYNGGKCTLSDDEIMEDHLSRLKVYNKKEKITGWMPNIPRQESQKLGVDERIDNNKEVNLGFTGAEAIAEAERCMRCYYISMVAV